MFDLNKLAHAMQSRFNEEEGAQTYRVMWESSDSKTPRFLRFGPDGNMQLAYCRDGIFNTTGNAAGTYTRVKEFAGPKREHHEMLLVTTSPVWLVSPDTGAKTQLSPIS